MPTERRGPICNSQFESIRYNDIDNGRTLKHVKPEHSRNVSAVHGSLEKKQSAIFNMFDRHEKDPFLKFYQQPRRGFGSACTSDPVSCGRDFSKSASNVIISVIKSFNSVADIGSYAKPVAAAVLYWGITLGGIIGMGALGYHVLNSNAEQTQQTDTKLSTPKPRP